MSDLDDSDDFRKNAISKSAQIAEFATEINGNEMQKTIGSMLLATVLIMKCQIKDDKDFRKAVHEAVDLTVNVVDQTNVNLLLSGLKIIEESEGNE
jgi:hypothetical protein